MIVQTPTKYFLVSGCAEGFTELNALTPPSSTPGWGTQTWSG